jgi:hypothetical protein
VIAPGTPSDVKAAGKRIASRVALHPWELAQKLGRAIDNGVDNYFSFVRSLVTA